MSDTPTIPEGFTVDGGEPSAKHTAPAIPEGFSLEATSNTPAVGQEPGIGMYMADQFRAGAAGVVGLAGLPVSAVNQVLQAADIGYNKLTGAQGRHVSSEHPVGGVEHMTKIGESAFAVQHWAQPKDPISGGYSKSSQYLGTLANFAGAMIVPGAATTAVAERKLATATAEAIGTFNAATLSVEGKGWGKNMAHYYGLNEEQGAAIGEAVGGLLSTGPTTFANKYLQASKVVESTLAKNSAYGFSADAQKASANSLLQKDINKSMEAAPQSVANLQRSLELSKKIPEWKPTLAQMTGAPGLIAIHKEVANKSAESLARAAAADMRNLEAITAYKERTFPKASAESGVIGATDPARARLSAQKSVMGMDAEKATADLRRLGASFQRTADNQVIGDQLREKYWEARDTAKGALNSQLQGVYRHAKAIGLQEDVSDIREAVKKIVNSDRQTFQNLPPLFSKVLNEFPEGKAGELTREAVTKAGATKPVYRTTTSQGVEGKSTANFEELHSLYKQANKDWADAIMAGDSTKAHYMDMIKQQLQAKVSKYSDPKYGQFADKFKEFNSNYAKYAQVFNEGAGGALRKRTRNGLSTDSEDIVKGFLQTADKKKGIQDFFNIYGTDEKAVGLLEEGILDSFSKQAMRTGEFNPKAAQAWMHKHGTAMGELPEMKAALMNTTEVSGMLVNRRLQAVKQRQVLDRTEIAKISKSAQPDKVIEDALRNPNKMKGLVVGAITEDGKKAVSRGLVDAIAARPDSYQYLLAHQDTLQPIFEKLGKGHWQNVKDIAEMGEIASRVKAPTQVELAKMADPVEQATGTSAKGLLSRFMNMNRALGLKPEYVVADVGGRYFFKTRNEELGRLREAAMFDPEVGQVLAKIAKQGGEPTKAQLIDLQRVCFNAGVVGTVEAVQRKGERERERAVIGLPTSPQ